MIDLGKLLIILHACFKKLSIAHPDSYREVEHPDPGREGRR
jgi:hypothetical protein